MLYSRILGFQIGSRFGSGLLRSSAQRCANPPVKALSTPPVFQGLTIMGRAALPWHPCRLRCRAPDGTIRNKQLHVAPVIAGTGHQCTLLVHEWILFDK